MPEDKVPMKPEPEMTTEEIYDALTSDGGAVRPKKSRRIVKGGGVKKATDEQCEAFVNEILATYKGLVTPSKHWSLTLIGVITKLNYCPAPRLLANRDAITCAIGDLSALAIVQKHVSPEMLADLEKHLHGWTIEAPADEDDIITDGDKPLAYSTGKVEVETSASDKQESWGSW